MDEAPKAKATNEPILDHAMHYGGGEVLPTSNS